VYLCVLDSEVESSKVVDYASNFLEAMEMEEEKQRSRGSDCEFCRQSLNLKSYDDPLKIVV